jgi:hypothetical protein
MSDIKQQLENYIKATGDIQQRIKEFNERPDPVLIGEGIILEGLSLALLAGSALLAPKMAAVAGVIKVGGKILEMLAKRKETKDAS